MYDNNLSYLNGYTRFTFLIPSLYTEWTAKKTKGDKMKATIM